MREVMRKVGAVSGLNIPVLLLGETGTGKSLLAQVIHLKSPRKDSHFIKVNCPALSPTLFESELFGHAKGSFTGAVSKRVGRFELAHGGTLFLDEIAELSPEMQSKFLQVLEDARFERVGESVSLAVNVRVLAATNVHPGSAVAQGKLRADLYYRLSPCVIELPPLRRRLEDIPPLAAALSAQVSAALGLPGIAFSKSMLQPLLNYSWPGNVRELRNVVSKLLVLRSMGKTLSTAVLEDVLRENNQTTIQAAGNPPPQGPQEEQGKNKRSEETKERDETLAAMEKEHILRILRRTGGVVSGPHGAAEILGLPRTTLQNRMRKLGLR
jgi:transcriptional regulator with PAS, ATPase and Fis domain